MKPIVVVMRRPVVVITLVAAVVATGFLGMSARGAKSSFVDSIGMAFTHAKEFIGGTLSSQFGGHQKESHREAEIVVTTPMIKDVVITQSFVCQIRSQRHIEVKALDSGYLEKIFVNEGQAVKKGDMMFQILPILYKTRLDAENAKAKLAELKYEYALQLVDKNVVSKNEASLLEAELAEARATAERAAAELKFTEITAPFDGIVDRLLQREGSLIKEGDILTTLADNSVMWVYFNVPERYYLHYMATRKERERDDKIELVLANGDVFPETGKIGAIEADFNNENGNIKFRADYPNPDGLLRHGQTGTIKVRRPLKDALVIPQRTTFELLDNRYVWLIDEDDIAHQRLITTKFELEDIFVVDSGLDVKDKIVLDGIRDIEEGEKVEYKFRAPEDVLKNQKFRAE